MVVFSAGGCYSVFSLLTREWEIKLPSEKEMRKTKGATMDNALILF